MSSVVVALVLALVAALVAAMSLAEPDGPPWRRRAATRAVEIWRATGRLGAGLVRATGRLLAGLVRATGRLVAGISLATRRGSAAAGLGTARGVTRGVRSVRWLLARLWSGLRPRARAELWPDGQEWQDLGAGGESGRRRSPVRFRQALEVTAPEAVLVEEPLFAEPGPVRHRAARSLAVLRLVVTLVLIGATIGAVMVGLALEIHRLTG